MDNIYDTLAKLNKVANAPKIVKEDSNALMKKGLEDLMKKTKLNKQADYKPFGKGDKDYETGLPKDAKKDPMEEANDDLMKMTKFNKQADYTPFSDKQSPDGLPEKKKDDKMFEAPGGQTKHEFIRQLFKTYFGQPDYNEMTGGRSGMRRLKIITGTTRSGYPNNQKQQDTSAFEKQLKAAGLDQVRVKSDPGGKAVTVLYPDDFRMQSLAEADLVEAPSGQTKHELIRQLFKSHFGQPQYNELTGGRSGMRRLKLITGTTRGTGYEFANDGPPEDTSDFERAIGKAGLSGDVRVKADGKAITVLYPDDFRMQSVTDSVTEAELVEKESDVERDDHDEEAGRKVAHDAKYDHMDHSGKDGDDVVKDLEYDQKNESSGGTLKDAARAGVMARLAELAGLPAQEIEEALGDSPEDTASRIMSEVSLDEEDTNEGNEFTGALEDAKKNGKSEFEVDGKKYKVEAIDSDEDAIQESDIDQIADVGKVYPKIAKMKMKLVDDGMEPEDAHDEACEKYNVDPAMCDKYIEMQRDDRETKKVSEGGGRDMECSHCDGTGKDDDKECKSCEGSGEAQDDDDPMNNESKVEETTSSGSVATSEAGGKALYKNASVYENNEIVKRAKQLNEDMSFTVSGGPDQEPTLNINASGTEAQQLGQLLKLSGLGMKPAAPQYGEVEIQVAEDQEFANGADDENTMDTEYMTQDIAGGLNGPKKMAYPKVAGGDNPMAVLEESELNEVGEERLMKLYQEYKAN